MHVVCFNNNLLLLLSKLKRESPVGGVLIDNSLNRQKQLLQKCFFLLPRLLYVSDTINQSLWYLSLIPLFTHLSLPISPLSLPILLKQKLNNLPSSFYSVLFPFSFIFLGKKENDRIFFLTTKHYQLQENSLPLPLV